MTKDLTSEYIKSLENARNQALEEAAIYVDENDLDWCNAWNEHLRGYLSEPKSLADGIRSLKTKERKT